MLTVVIQAGGMSKRMGRDKALLPFLGQTLIERIIARINPIADEILITTNQPEHYQFLGIPLFTDREPGRGALGGLYTALDAASHPLVGVIACDMPFVNPLLLQAQKNMLVDSAYDAVIPRTDHGLEPFHAVYRKASCLEYSRQALQEGKWRVDAWFERASVRILLPEEIQLYDPQNLAFMNVNTPDELQQVEQIARNL